jgi:hypothetical protein
MAIAKEREALVRSVARFLAGLKPKRAANPGFYCFERYGRKVIERVYELKRIVVGLTCPFCRRRFKRSSGFVYHIVKMHRLDVEEFIGVRS